MVAAATHSPGSSRRGQTGWRPTHLARTGRRGSPSISVGLTGYTASSGRACGWVTAAGRDPAPTVGHRGYRFRELLAFGDDGVRTAGRTRTSGRRRRPCRRTLGQTSCLDQRRSPVRSTSHDPGRDRTRVSHHAGVAFITRDRRGQPSHASRRSARAALPWPRPKSLSMFMAVLPSPAAMTRSHVMKSHYT